MLAEILFSYEHHFKFPKIITGFIFKVTNFNVKMCLLIVILKETLVLMGLESHFDIIES